MAQAKTNDTVKVHYTGTFSDGTVFDSSTGREPFEFTIGQGMVIPGFEGGIIGMEEGDSRQITIAADDGYGPYRDELVGIVPRSKMPPDLNPEIGMLLQVNSPDGEVAGARIKDVTETEVTIDLNHPLAGKDLLFDIKLIEVVVP